jgi:hypothetical protein
MMSRFLTLLLACALAFGGEASARPARNRSSPVYECYWNGTKFWPGGYCVGRGGIVQVCLSAGDWMSVGGCRGEECRATCPG